MDSLLDFSLFRREDPLAMSAFRRIAERAFVANPIRTEIDLLALGARALLTDLKHDYRVGRLQATVAALEPETSSARCPDCRQTHGTEAAAGGGA